MQTPWGKSDSIIKIERGVSWVRTPSHGGLAITRMAAVSLLSQEARAQAERYGSYLFFEEDSAYAIAFYEHPEWYRAINPTDSDADQKIRAASDDEIRATFLPGLSRYHADYLLARGITPEAKNYAVYQQWQEEDRLRAAKSPDLIVSAFGDWANWVPAGKVGVYTADNKQHLINAADYPNKGFRLSAYPEAEEVK